VALRCRFDPALKDAGFSALTLAWVLKGFDIRAATTALGLRDADANALLTFRQARAVGSTHGRRCARV